MRRIFRKMPILSLQESFSFLVEASLFRRHEWSHTDKWPKGVNSFTQKVPPHDYLLPLAL
jgi:hypothetical protein